MAYGLREIFGEHVHIFFAEPVASPCMTIGLMTGLHDAISVEDIGLDNKTEADGLAVGRASKFVGKVMETYISGCYTVSDQELFTSLGLAMDSEALFLEPSANAGMFGAIRLLQKRFVLFRKAQPRQPPIASHTSCVGNRWQYGPCHNACRLFGEEQGVGLKAVLCFYWGDDGSRFAPF